MKRVLFICGKGRQRSPTAEQIFANHEDWEVDSAGISSDADISVSPEQINWATHIVVMDKKQISRLRRNFSKHVAGRKMVSLDIPDVYSFMQTELVELLQSRIKRLI